MDEQPEEYHDDGHEQAQAEYEAEADRIAEMEAIEAQSNEGAAEAEHNADEE